MGRGNKVSHPVDALRKKQRAKEKLKHKKLRQENREKALKRMSAEQIREEISQITRKEGQKVAMESDLHRKKRLSEELASQRQSSKGRGPAQSSLSSSSSSTGSMITNSSSSITNQRSFPDHRVGVVADEDEDEFEDFSRHIEGHSEDTSSMMDSSQSLIKEDENGANLTVSSLKEQSKDESDLAYSRNESDLYRSEVTSILLKAVRDARKNSDSAAKREDDNDGDENKQEMIHSMMTSSKDDSINDSHSWSDLLLSLSLANDNNNNNNNDDQFAYDSDDSVLQSDIPCDATSMLLEFPPGLNPPRSVAHLVRPIGINPGMSVDQRKQVMLGFIVNAMKQSASVTPGQPSTHHHNPYPVQPSQVSIPVQAQPLHHSVMLHHHQHQQQHSRLKRPFSGQLSSDSIADPRESIRMAGQSSMKRRRIEMRQRVGRQKKSEMDPLLGGLDDGGDDESSSMLDGYDLKRMNDSSLFGRADPKGVPSRSSVNGYPPPTERHRFNRALSSRLSRQSNQPEQSSSSLSAMANPAMIGPQIGPQIGPDPSSLSDTASYAVPAPPKPREKLAVILDPRVKAMVPASLQRRKR